MKDYNDYIVLAEAIDPNVRKLLDVLSEKVLDALSEINERIDAIESTTMVSLDLNMNKTAREPLSRPPSTSRIVRKGI